MGEISIDELAAKVEPVPGAILIFGGVGRGKTTAVTCLKSAYERLGSQVSAIDNCDTAMVEDAGTSEWPAAITAFISSTMLDSSSLHALLASARVVICFEYWWRPAHEILDRIKGAGFNTEGLRHEVIQNLKKLQAVVVSRDEPPALLKVHPHGTAPEAPMMTRRLNGLVEEINRRCHPDREPADCQGVLLDCDQLGWEAIEAILRTYGDADRNAAKPTGGLVLKLPVDAVFAAIDGNPV